MGEVNNILIQGSKLKVFSKVSVTQSKAGLHKLVISGTQKTEARESQVQDLFRLQDKFYISLVDKMIKKAISSCSMSRTPKLVYPK